MRYVVLILIPLCAAGCRKPEFWPYKNTSVITEVNKRKPYDEKLIIGPSYITDEDYARGLFMKSVQMNGTYESGFCLLEIDGVTIDAAVCLASHKEKMSKESAELIRRDARKKLFKQGARSFLLVHNAKGVYALHHPEPELISQSKGKGELVGMSLETGLGLKSGEVGLLMFEDKVGMHDSSHAVRINFTFASEATGLGKSSGWLQGVPQTQKTFTFKGEASPLSMLKDAFAPHLPAPTKLPAVQTSGVTVQDAVIVAEVALRILRFLKKA